MSFAARARPQADDESTSRPALPASAACPKARLKGAGSVHEDRYRATVRAAMEALRLARDAERRIAEQAARIAHLERLARTDPLTGLLNRRGFHDVFERAVARARRYDERGVLVYIDLDSFKLVNDTYGHAAGDAMLCHVARVLVNGVRDTDDVARVWGDEFAALLSGASRDHGVVRAQSLDTLVNRSFVTWRGHSLAVAASVGIQTYGPRDCGDAVLDGADGAMYRAKRRRTARRGERPAA